VPKIHGKKTKVFFNSYDLTEYFDNANPSINADTAEVSTFGSTSKKYIAGLKDATLSLEGFFDGSAAAVDEVMEAAFGSEGNEVSVYPEGDVAGKAGYAMQAIETAYSPTETVDGACRISAAVQSSGTGAERVISLHALGEEDDDWTSSVLDNGASSSDGGSAYLHVTDATGTVEVKIQHSSDDFSSDTTDLASFAAVSGATSERVSFTGSVKRYVRAVATIAGGETITFQLGFHRA
jgi:hypothetical protein